MMQPIPSRRRSLVLGGILVPFFPSITYSSDTPLPCRYNRAPDEDNVDGLDNNPIYGEYEEPCLPDVNGNFGSTDGGSITFDFFYQIETNSSVDNTTIADILRQVEPSISRTILPDLFVEQCAPIQRSRHERNPRRRRRQQVRGVSASPTDQVLDSVPCQGETASDCYVMDGKMTIFSTTQVDEKLFDNLHVIIRLAMNGGLYNNLHPSILQVTYLSKVDPEQMDPVMTGSDTDSTQGGGLPAFFWAFITVGAAALLFFIVFSLRRRRGDDEHEPFASMGDDGSFPNSPREVSFPSPDQSPSPVRFVTFPGKQ